MAGKRIIRISNLKIYGNRFTNGMIHLFFDDGTNHYVSLDGGHYEKCLMLVNFCKATGLSLYFEQNANESFYTEGEVDL